MSARSAAVLAVFGLALAVVVHAVVAARGMQPTPAQAPWRVPPSPSGGGATGPAALDAGRSLPWSACAGAVGPAAPHVVFRYRAGARITGPVALDALGRIYLTAHDGRLHALDADGALRFTRALAAPDGGGPLPAWGGPLVQGGRVLAGSEAGVLHAFGLTGEPRATATLGHPIDRTPVALPDGGVGVVAGPGVTVLDAQLVPRFRFDAWDEVFARPAVDGDGGLYVASQDDHLHALDPRGAVRFRFRARGDLDGAPRLWGERVVVGSDDGHVYALDVRTGRLRWATALGGPVRAPLAAGPGGRLWATTFGPWPRVVGLSAADGRVVASYSPGPLEDAARGFASGACVDAAGQLYVGGHDDQLHALSATATLRFRLPVRGVVSATPVLRQDGTLIFATEGGWVYGVRDPGTAVASPLGQPHTDGLE